RARRASRALRATPPFRLAASASISSDICWGSTVSIPIRSRSSLTRRSASYGGVECGRPIDLIADRARPLDIEASAPGWTTARAEFPAGTRPLDQEFTLELERSHAFAGLELTWTPSDDKALSWVQADLWRSGGCSSTIVRGGERGCRLENLVPGH